MTSSACFVCPANSPTPKDSSVIVTNYNYKRYFCLNNYWKDQSTIKTVGALFYLMDLSTCRLMIAALAQKPEVMRGGSQRIRRSSNCCFSRLIQVKLFTHKKPCNYTQIRLSLLLNFRALSHTVVIQTSNLTHIHPSILFFPLSSRQQTGTLVVSAAECAIPLECCTSRRGKEGFGHGDDWMTNYRTLRLSRPIYLPVCATDRWQTGSSLLPLPGVWGIL